MTEAANERLVFAATPVAERGPEHVADAVSYDAILLVSFGGPENPNDVLPFLRNVTRGRGVPEARLEEVAHHYRAFGGVSPINAQNRELKAAMERELAARGIDLPVIWGNRNWSPYISEVLSEARVAGFSKLIAIATSAYSSYSSCRQYREDCATALGETGLANVIEIDKVRQFFDHPGFVTPFVTGVASALRTISDAIPDIDLAGEVEVLFSTHSIPSADAAASGPPSREFGEGGAYEAQHRAVAEVVVAQALRELTAVHNEQVPRAPHRLSWQLVYQSRSGPPAVPWLEPDINDVIAQLPRRGIRAVIIVPIGFVSDHLEVKWDLDIEARETAAQHGLAVERVSTPGVHPAFVSGLVDLVLERRDGVPVSNRPALTSLGPWYDVCRPGCCGNARAGVKSAIAGLES